MTHGTTVREKLCAFTGIAQFADLPEQVRSDLAAICRPRTYSANETVAEIGTHPSFIGIVSDGILRMQKTLPDGRQHVVGLLVAGDMFGRVFDGNMHFSVEAATDATVFQLQRRPMEDLLLRSPELDRLLLLNMMSELDRARDWMIILANPKVRGRLAGFLLLFCTRFRSLDHLVRVQEGAIHVRIPLVRADLAHLLGTRVESISRGLHALADDRLIEILKPDLVEIREIDALIEEVGDPDLVDQSTLKDMIRSQRKPIRRTDDLS